MQRGVAEPAGLAGLDTGWHVRWSETLPRASAQLCGSSFGLGTTPSPHHSGSEPPFPPGLPRKPFASFESPLINGPSICHLRPPLPTLSRGLPRAAPKLSTPASSRLPPAPLCPPLASAPFPAWPGAERAQNRSGKRKTTNTLALKQGRLGESHRTWGCPRPDSRPPSWGPEGWRAVPGLLASTELRGAQGFSSFLPLASFLEKVLTDTSKAVESILSDPGCPFPASVFPAHSQLTSHVGKPTQIP